MIQSMTGFGQASATHEGQRISVEIRSLNSRGLDLNLRMPHRYRERDLTWRKMIGDAVQRGKVDVSINREQAEGRSNGLQEAHLRQTMQDLQRIAGGSLTPAEALAMALRVPTEQGPAAELDPAEAKAVEALIRSALEAFQTFRSHEGSALARDLEANLATIEQGLPVIEAAEPERLEHLKGRLTKAAVKAADDQPMDPQRWEQELLFYVEKIDINEEKVRLKAHIKHFHEALSAGEGRKLGFLAQELGREINTLGNKAHHVGMQRQVVQMKEDLEKIKEQVLNVL